ncbi:MAG: helix-turn-helix domain-containing protein [Planctomycetes bacterium]|nr:helix-turn-helix domain-containing protein [Planctomycetota bacterium]
MPEYFSFEDVMGELQLDEEELKRMVSEGELRAFRDENKMKFRKDDVESLKKGRITEPTIVLPTPSRGSDKPTQEEGETILDFASDSSAGTPSVRPDETAVPAIDVGAGGEGSETGSETAAGETTGITEEMIFEDSDLTVPKEDSGTGTNLEAQETVVEGGESGEQTTGMTTEPLTIQEDSGTGTQEESGQVTEESSGTGEEEEAPARGRRPAPARAPRAPVRAKGAPAFTAMLCVSSILLICTGVVLGEYMMIEPGKSDKPSGFTAGICGAALKVLGTPEQQQWWDNFTKK